jgi:hypothetical protein
MVLEELPAAGEHLARDPSCRAVCVALAPKLVTNATSRR